MRNVLFVISGPSGVGKGTVAKKVCEDIKNVSLSISCTTRRPRVGEENGKDYFFISKEDFISRIGNGDFLEYSNHFENYYGTPKSFVLDKLKTRDVLLEIDVNGGLSVKKAFPEAVLIMLLPPDIETLKSRLKGRGTESDDKIAERIERVDYELGKKDLYDYTVVNDDLGETVKNIEKILKSEKLK